MTPKGSRENVKNTILALLLSRKGGCTLKQLNADYEEAENEQIPWKQFGFPSLLKFIYSMPDIIQVENRNNTLILRGIPTDKSKHISKLVSEQKTQPARGRSYRPSRYYPGASLYTRAQIPLPALERIMDLIREYPDGVEKVYVLEQLNLCMPGLNITMKDMEEQFKKFPSRVYQNSNMVYPVKDIQKYDYSTQNTNSVPSKSVIITAAGCEDHILDYDDDDIFDFVPGPINSSQECTVTSNIKPTSSFIEESISKYQDQYDITKSEREPATKYNVYEESNGVIRVELANNTRKDKEEPVHDKDDQIIINEKLRCRLIKLAEKHPDGIWCADLPTKYLQEYGHHLQYSELGFNSVKEFTSYLSDIFRSIQIKDDFKLYPAKTDLSAFIRKERRSYDPENKEAVPSKLSFNTMKAFVPDEVMSNGDRIDYIKPQNLLLNGSCYLEVFVVEVFTPTFFWIQLRKKQNEFQELMHNLERFYNQYFDKYLIPPIVLDKGLNCACKYNSKWHRAIIEKVSPDFAITVMFYDFGTLKTYSVNEVYYLHNRFSDLPAQAIPCGLSNIMPRSGSKWSFTATQRFAERTGKIPLVATITSTCDEDNSMMIILTDTGGEDDVQINDWLIAENIAIKGTEIGKVDMNNLLLYDEENLINNHKVCYEEEPQTFNVEEKRTTDRKIANTPLISPQSTLDDTAFVPSSLRNECKMSPLENVKNQNLRLLHLFRYNRNNTNPFLQDEKSVYDTNIQEFVQLWNENLIVQTQISETLNLLLNKLSSAKDEDTLNKLKLILSNAYMQIPNCTDPVNADVANICKDTITSISSYLWDIDENKTPLFSTSSSNNNTFNGYTAPVQSSNIQEATKYPNWTNNNYLIPGSDYNIANRQNWEVEKFGQSRFNMDVQNYFKNNDVDLFVRAEKPVDSTTTFKETNPFRLSLPAKLQMPSVNEKEGNLCKNRKSVIYDVTNIENNTNNQYANGNIKNNSTSSSGNEYLHSTNNDERNNSVTRYTAQMHQSQSVDDITKAMSNIVIGDPCLLPSSIPKENSHCLSTSKDFLSSYDLQSKKKGPIFVDTFNIMQSASIQNSPMLVTTNGFGYSIPGNNKTLNDGYLPSTSASRPLCNSHAIVKTKNVPEFNQKLMLQNCNGMGSLFEEKNKVCKDSCQVSDSKKWTSENWTSVKPISQNKANTSSEIIKQQNSIQAVQDLSNVHLDNVGLQALYANQCKFKGVVDSSSCVSLNAKLFFQVFELRTGIIHIFHYKDDGWLLLDEFVDKFTQFERRWSIFNWLTALDMSIRFEEVDRTKCSIEFLTTNSIMLKPTRDILNGVTQLYLVSLQSAIQVLCSLEIISQDDVNAIFMYETFLSNSVAYEIWLVMNAYKQLKCSVEQSG